MAKTTTTELPQPFTAYACQRLRKLRAKRVQAKKELDERVKERKSLEEQLNDLGKADSPEKRELATEYWETIRAIDLCRADIQSLAEKIDKTIEDGDQLELIPGAYDDDLDDPPADDRPRPKAGGRGKAAKAADQADPDDDRPVGEPDAKPSPRPGPDLKLARPSPEPWHDIDVGNIGLPDRVAAALRNAEMPSLGAVDARDFRLTTVDGVSPRYELHIETVVAALKDGKTREEAVEEAERAVKEAPPSGKTKRSRKA